MSEIKTIIISRTDSIGDVVLTLPIVHSLKKKFVGCRIIFLGKTYTKPVLECCQSIDEILCWDEIELLGQNKQIELFGSLKADCLIHVFPNKKVASLAKKAGIPMRIGTSHRLFHWFTCNKLPNFTRKNSDFHEAQLNFKLLEPIDVSVPSLAESRNYFDFTKAQPLSSVLSAMIDHNRYNLILHPKSKGSAAEWGIDNFYRLIKLLPKDKFKIFISGTKQEGELVKDIFSENPDAVDLTGKLTLTELISFINNCNGLVAASTGPLHLAAVLGKKAVGLYPSVRPIDPGRWAPLGKNVSVLQSDNVSDIKPEEVAKVLTQGLK